MRSISISLPYKSYRLSDENKTSPGIRGEARRVQNATRISQVGSKNATLSDASRTWQNIARILFRVYRRDREESVIATNDVRSSLIDDVENGKNAGSLVSTYQHGYGCSGVAQHSNGFVVSGLCEIDPVDFQDFIPRLQHPLSRTVGVHFGHNDSLKSANYLV